MDPNLEDEEPILAHSREKTKWTPDHTNRLADALHQAIAGRETPIKHNEFFQEMRNKMGFSIYTLDTHLKEYAKEYFMNDEIDFEQKVKTAFLGSVSIPEWFEGIMRENGYVVRLKHRRIIKIEKNPSGRNIGQATAHVVRREPIDPNILSKQLYGNSSSKKASNHFIDPEDSLDLDPAGGLNSILHQAEGLHKADDSPRTSSLPPALPLSAPNFKVLGIRPSAPEDLGMTMPTCSTTYTPIDENAPEPSKVMMPNEVSGPSPLRKLLQKRDSSDAQALISTSPAITRKRGSPSVQVQKPKRSKVDISVMFPELPPIDTNAYAFMYKMICFLAEFEHGQIKDFVGRLAKHVGPKKKELDSKRLTAQDCLALFAGLFELMTLQIKPGVAGPATELIDFHEFLSNFLDHVKEFMTFAQKLPEQNVIEEMTEFIEKLGTGELMVPVSIIGKAFVSLMYEFALL